MTFIQEGEFVPECPPARAKDRKVNPLPDMHTVHALGADSRIDIRITYEIFWGSSGVTSPCHCHPRHFRMLGKRQPFLLLICFNSDQLYTVDIAWFSP